MGRGGVGVEEENESGDKQANRNKNHIDDKDGQSRRNGRSGNEFGTRNQHEDESKRK